MQQIANFAEAFIKLFNLGGENLMGLVTGILPTLLVLITLVNAIIAIVGQERVDKLAALASKNVITRYTILPILAVFFLTNPMCYNFGKIVEEKEVTNKMLEKTVIKEVLNKFLGKQEQIPPIYSAIKVNGKKLYEYARKGQTVKIKPRQIEIYSIELLSIDKKLKQIEFEVSCSKGTYIRSLCEDIGNKLRNCSIYERIAKNQGWGFFYNKCNKY